MKKIFLLALLCITFLASCGGVKFEPIEITSKVELHTELQVSYLNDDYKNVLNYVTGVEELSRPVPVTLEWMNKGVKASNYEVLVSEKEDLSNPYQFQTEKTSLDVYNLKIKTTYYWNVTAIDGETKTTSKTSSFETTDLAIRNIYVDGVTNFRDVGGWTIDSTHRVKQGLLYRCGRLNVSSVEEVELCVTNSGIDTLTNFLHMKTEIDLRKTEDNEVGSITSCVASNDINYVSAPIVYTKPILSSNMGSWKEIFKVLGDETNYPIMYHCNIGTDRTGVMTYLILGLLGVELDDIYVDYCFSNFANINQYRDYASMTTSIGKVITNREEETLSAKIYGYLVSQGVSSEDLDRMISILTEEI